MQQNIILTFSNLGHYHYGKLDILYIVSVFIQIYFITKLTIYGGFFLRHIQNDKTTYLRFI